MSSRKKKNGHIRDGYGREASNEDGVVSGRSSRYAAGRHAGAKLNQAGTLSARYNTTHKVLSTVHIARSADRLFCVHKHRDRPYAGGRQILIEVQAVIYADVVAGGTRTQTSLNAGKRGSNCIYAPVGRECGQSLIACHAALFFVIISARGETKGNDQA